MSDDTRHEPGVEYFAVRAQAEITISVEDNGDLILRQYDSLGNDPAVIVVTPENLEALIDSIHYASAATASASVTPTVTLTP